MNTYPKIIIATVGGEDITTNSITIQGNWLIYGVDGGGFKLPNKMMSIVNVK